MPDRRAEQRAAYGRFIKRKRIALVIAAGATVLVALFAISAGSLNIPLQEIAKAFFGGGDRKAHV